MGWTLGGLVTRVRTIFVSLDIAGRVGEKLESEKSWKSFIVLKCAAKYGDKAAHQMEIANCVDWAEYLQAQKQNNTGIEKKQFEFESHIWFERG